MAPLLLLDVALIDVVSAAFGLCLAVYGLSRLVTGRGGRLTPAAISRSGGAAIRWYGASWLPWAAYFMAGPWLLTAAWSTTSVVLLALGAVALECVFLLGAWLARR